MGVQISLWAGRFELPKAPPSEYEGKCAGCARQGLEAAFYSKTGRFGVKSSSLLLGNTLIPYVIRN
jgi:hypothetical protein